MIAALLALTACTFLLAPLPALAQDASNDPGAQAQEAEIPREVRVLVQRGLAFLGFDPGPADGLFGPRTRAAIWDWQAAKELDATGYLALAEAEALAAIGAEASGSLEVEFEEPAQRGQEPESAEAETATAPSLSRNQVLYFPTCGTDDAEPDGCWVPLTSPAECVYWWPISETVAHGDLVPWWYDAPYTWSGECDNTSRATGLGTLDWETDFGIGNETHLNESGEFVEGRRQGHWVIRLNFVGQIAVSEGPYVNGLRHGRWRTQGFDGTFEIYEFRHGELVR
ncbi:MAG: peptidoglycan-binding domain-containing protein [Gammaproteobacteria bacterium]|nr:peptidoglycan-binding domain-containing protein [Gammaproteobacteria bacterium]